MDYEQLLDIAMSNVDKTERCERFEVKKISLIHEGSNKTIITNFLQVALCLRRDPGHIARFLYKNLASYGEVAGERLILGRKISPEIVQKKVELYVNEYVKCPKCGKPDSEIFEESNVNYLKCLACGTKIKINKI
jgi:translation initiation factor 2 subunit 2